MHCLNCSHIFEEGDTIILLRKYVPQDKKVTYCSIECAKQDFSEYASSEVFEQPEPLDADLAAQ